MMGSRDSELAVVIEDKSKLPSKMNGQPYQAAKFAHEFRKRVFKSLFGFTNDQEVEDPLSPQMWDEIENRKCVDIFDKKNTEIYREVFGCYPDSTAITADHIMPLRCNAKPHLYEQLAPLIKGYHVEFPLNFLGKDDLKKMKHFEFGLYMLPHHIFT